MRDSLIKIMPQHLRTMLSLIPTGQWQELQEIRLRVGKPISIVSSGKEYGLGTTGLGSFENGYKATEQDVQSILKFISGFSMYALEEDIRQGYITIEGGHRVGLVGKAVLENRGIKTLKHISAINIRISHEVIDCSKKVLQIGRAHV